MKIEIRPKDGVEVSTFEFKKDEYRVHLCAFDETDNYVLINISPKQAIELAKDINKHPYIN